MVMEGQVVQVAGGVYTVRADGDVLEASLRGRIKLDDRHGDRVVIGDRVEVQSGEGGANTIEAVLPRTTWLVRRTLGGRRQKIVAANLDRLVVLAAARDPEPSASVIDRMLVMGEAGGMDCVLVVTKLDLVDDRTHTEELVSEYRGAGYPVHLASVVSGEGMEGVEEMLCHGSSALVGPSGVGKSTLVNSIEPSVSLLTREVGRRSRAGRHTTVSSRLIPLSCGGHVADTPGFSDVGLGDVSGETLPACFPEFRPYLADCHFRDCTHAHEPGCAVVAAVHEGRIPLRRYESYKTILEDIA